MYNLQDIQLNQVCSDMMRVTMTMDCATRKIRFESCKRGLRVFVTVLVLFLVLLMPAQGFANPSSGKKITVLLCGYFVRAEEWI